MSSFQIILIILSGLLAAGLALFQYINRLKKNKKVYILLVVLRFITIFSILLLLINPKFEQTSLTIQKPNLVVAIDNSESISHLNQTNNTLDFIKRIETHSELNSKFNLSYYTFGNQLKLLDSLSFNEKQSDFETVFNDLDQVYKTSISPTLFVTDGNQTYGRDFEFVSKNYKQPIYPIVLGDTTTHSDLKIQQLNVNKYAYHKNKFPVEIMTTYNGTQYVNTQLIITSGNTVVHRENLSFNKAKNSVTLNIDLLASRVGVNAFKATIKPLESEKNKTNNTKPFAVEVIDQKTNIALVSDIIHPDIGAFKKAIESNEQRSVTLIDIDEKTINYGNYQLVIAYQPNSKFKTLYKTLDQLKINHFLVIGNTTDWQFISEQYAALEKDITTQTEDFLAAQNTAYNTFIVDDLDFYSFPPLQSAFGEVQINSALESILYKKIGKIETQQPLLATLEEDNKRAAFLFGEGIWKWRAQSYLNEQSFKTFDNFIGKIVQYLASDKKRTRLNVDYESFYNGNSNIKIGAQFFNKNYEFDDKASITITLKNKETSQETIIPFILKQNYYEVDLSGFKSGDYNFTVIANNGQARQFGNLKILEYNVEQQFLNANTIKLQRIATQSQGKSFFIDNASNVIDALISDSRYVSLQKSNKKIVPLIDWIYLLILIALSLALEWFIRKYNGLI